MLGSMQDAPVPRLDWVGTPLYGQVIAKQGSPSSKTLFLSMTRIILPLASQTFRPQPPYFWEGALPGV
jgi:hypothetical protein